nr:reverse transcriptase domain-containing protein [Tanacetum cinerariifolium]
MIPGKGDLRDYWRSISTDGDFLGPPPSYTLISDPVLRLCHRMMAHSIAGSCYIPKKVTVTDLFYLRGLDVGSINIPYLLARYLRRFSAVRKSKVLISGGKYVARLADHFGLLTEERLQGLTVIVRELLVIDMAKLVRLQIYEEIDETWAWVALGPKRQPDATVGAPGATRDALIVDEGDQQSCHLRQLPTRLYILILSLRDFSGYLMMSHNHKRPRRGGGASDEKEENLALTNSVAPTPSPPISPQTKVLFSQTRLRKAQKTVRLQPPMATSTKALIAEFASTHIPPSPLTSPLYLEALLGYKAVMIQMRDASQPLAPSPPLLLPSVALRDYIPEADMPLRKKDKSMVLEVNIRTLEAQKMPPKKTTTTPMIDTAIKALIAQGVVDALAEYEAHRNSGNGDDSHDSRSDRRTERATHDVLTWWNSHVKTIGHNAAYGMTWKTLRKMMTDKYYPRSELKKLEIEIWNLKVKGTDVVSYTQCFQELALMCGRMFLEEFDEFEKSPATVANNQRALVENQRVVTCFECGVQGNYKKYCLKLKNNNHGNQASNGGATTRAFAVGNARKNLDANVVTSTFLVNKRYISILFDTSDDKSFVSTVFSSLIDIVPTALDHDYDVELADGKIIRVNTIIRGYTLNFLNH